MLEVNCKGTAYEIGHQHGTAARDRVLGTKAFYEAFFKETAKIDWDAVCTEASKWLPLLQESYPQYVEEMQGIADATSLPLASILALNVRTEVAYGMFSDGCTSLSIHSTSPPTAILAQNWDWRTGQAPNLIKLTIRATDGRAPLAIITEAGIIGKIGLSAAGLGVCLNAISALGVSYTRLPVHIALRAALDWAGTMTDDGSGQSTARRVAERLKERGVASPAHIFLADAHDAIGLEVSAVDLVEVRKLSARGNDVVVHSNHYIEEHPGVKFGSNQMKDSPQRLTRIEELVQTGNGAVNEKDVMVWLSDEENFPGSICRDVASGGATLFSIIMDLRAVRATVKEGKPNGDGEVFTLDPKAQA